MPGVLGLLLWVLTTVSLSLGHREVGYARDEGIYFVASRSYADWVARVGRDPSMLLDRKARDRAFAINHEHPALMKILGGLSARVIAGDTAAGRRGMPQGAAMRLPAQILAGFGVALLFWTARRWTCLAGGLLAAGAFILLPRVWFHAGLHAFDVPVAVATLAVGLTYLRALGSPRWGLALGPVLGVAIAIKHNALFLGPLLALHLWLTLGRQRLGQGRRIAAGAWVPLPLWSMAIGGPAVAWALWPWMWSDTGRRLSEYFAFHRQHNWYNMELLGVNYNQPPMPVHYPAVMTWATVPTVLLLLALLGVVIAWRRDRGVAGSDTDGGSFWRPIAGAWGRGEGLWLAILIMFPLALISAPGTPIFGGTKHWLTAYPFMALAVAIGWHALWKRAAWGWPSLAATASVAFVLGPTAIATIDGHPYGLSQYAPLVGGPRGAADLGLNRGFWGHAVLPLRTELAEAAQGGRVWLHDLHGAAHEQYVREGRWPTGVEPGALRQARAGLHFIERHMTADEVAMWEQLGTRTPHAVLTLDDVPLTTLYVAPSRSR